MEDIDNWDDASPWHPITDQNVLKRIGKLGEETCELGAALFRSIIQGLDEGEPKTHKINRDWVQDEVADVEANIVLVKEFLKLDEAAIAKRRDRKVVHLREWHEGASNRVVVAWRYESDEGGSWESQVVAAWYCPEGGPFGPRVRNVRALYE